jgi:hypothetical protein
MNINNKKEEYPRKAFNHFLQKGESVEKDQIFIDEQ